MAFRAVMAGRATFIALAPAAGAAPSLMPDPRTLESRITVALGGAHNPRTLQSLRAIGAMEGVSGFPGSYELEAQAPDRRKVTWDIHYLRQTTATDAESGWERSATVRELAGDELARDPRDARFNALFALIRDGYRRLWKPANARRDGRCSCCTSRRPKVRRKPSASTTRASYRPVTCESNPANRGRRRFARITRTIAGCTA